jgi:hypothetical protein
MFRFAPVVAVVALAIAVPAQADQPGRNWISSAKVTKLLAQRGYRVTKIEADDGHWEGEAVRHRLRYEFHVDPHNGRITKLERDRD